MVLEDEGTGEQSELRKKEAIHKSQRQSEITKKGPIGKS
jgi:hypothetical protein